jgi:hypothetical protein
MREEASAAVGRKPQGGYPLVRGVVIIPVREDTGPDWNGRRMGVTVELDAEHVVFDIDGDDALVTRGAVMGLERDNGRLEYAAVEILAQTRESTVRFRVEGRWGGLASWVLSADCLSPKLSTECLEYQPPRLGPVVDEWVRAGVLLPVLMDRVSVCPRCGALPTFRPGCPRCGSARSSQGRMIHHFACAHVGPADEFESTVGLKCPKCRMGPLVVGTDFEHELGPHTCTDCHWQGGEPEWLGQCVRCSHRFPASESSLVDLVGYDVPRLDLVALLAGA